MPAPAISLAHPAPASRNRGARREWRNAMKSAYGRQTPVPDYELTCVELGSPMGELMRRYWQPVCTSEELRGLPRKEKLLCEKIVVFRDKKGGVGPLNPTLFVAEHDNLLAQELFLPWKATQFLGSADRLPVAAHQLAHRAAQLDA